MKKLLLSIAGVAAAIAAIGQGIEAVKHYAVDHIQEVSVEQSTGPTLAEYKLSERLWMLETRIDSLEIR